MSRKKTLESFISDSKKIHNDKYDYSKFNYFNNKTKSEIICPIHGAFFVTPDNHVNKASGCPLCSNNRVKNTQEFINDSIVVHGHKYDYSNVNYINNYTKILIVCPKHGNFYQTPNAHLSGKGCPKCKNLNMDNESKIKKANLIHHNKYDYSKTDFTNVKIKSVIICPYHNEFKQSYDCHVNNKNGCPKCSKTQKLDRYTFIWKAIQVHGYKYDYNKTTYINARNKIRIICPKHGEFYQMPNAHLNGQGCAKCHGKSKLENIVFDFLRTNNIHFIFQQRFPWLGRLSLDFYLPKHNIAIECQGRQHFEPVLDFGGDNEFQKIIQRDERKRKLCCMNNVTLIEYSDIVFNDRIINQLSELLSYINDSTLISK